MTRKERDTRRGAGMGKGGLVTYESSDFFKLLFQIRGSIFDNVLSKVRRERERERREREERRD